MPRSRGRPTRASKEVQEMKIEITKVEAIKATRIHLDPSAGGA